MLLSAAMLNALPGVRWLAVGLAAAIAVAVCGLSTGLGAVFLDLQTRNPAAIVSSFGGTLNMVLNLAFLLAAIAPFGFLFHMRTIHALGALGFARGLALAGVWLLFITVAATALPLGLGARSLRRRDF
jgi:hypothetical protein